MVGEILTEWKKKLVDSGRNRWLVLLLLGLLLLVIAFPVSSEQEKQNISEESFWGDKEESMVEKSLLEEKLADLLESVEGVGNVRVMIMTGEKKDSDYYISKDEMVTGVLISAEGADHSVTVKNIQEAVMALFQVDAHKIKVMKMK